MWKHGRAGQTTDDKGYKHTLRMCNTYSFLWQQWLRERTSMLRYTKLPVLSVTKSVCTWMKALTGGLPPVTSTH
jgi:hypothetical protein